MIVYNKQLFSSIISRHAYSLLEQTELLSCEQRGYLKRPYGCKYQLLINGIIIENYHAKKRNLIAECIYYRKAFDGVPHSWILKTLDICKVSTFIIEMDISTKLINTFINVW